MNRRTGIVLAIAALAVGLVGCARPFGSTVGDPPTGDRDHQQARDALARWDEAVKAAGGQAAYVPIGQDMTLSDPGATLSEQYQGAIKLGRVVLSGVDPAQTQPAGRIEWASGATLELRTLTVGEAFAKVQGTGNCGGCTEAPVPLTVTFAGSPGTGKEPCGADYAAEAVESERAVVVIVTTLPRPEPSDALARACPAIGALRQATVDLAAPLGDRVVLETATGQPVPTAG